jgi:dolichol-phosphate mannosyltransferase
MLEKWQEGYKVIYGIRRNRRENLLKRACYFLFYRILQKISSIDIPLDAGDFCLMDRSVVLEMRRLNEDKPFVRGLRSWVGFKQFGIEYDRAARSSGETKYTFRKLVKLALDGWLSFSYDILRAGIFLGFAISLGSICVGFLIIGRYVLGEAGVLTPVDIPPGWQSLACLITFLIGLLFMFLGVIGEYVGRIFLQVKGRPLFVVEEEIGFDDVRNRD